MDEEKMNLARIEQLLEENLELGQENNRLIRDMRRAARLGFWFRLIIWLVVLILPFLLIVPLLNVLVPGATDGSSVFGLPSLNEFKGIYETIQNQQVENRL